MQLLLVRHARPVSQLDAPDGVADPGLTAIGRRQATALAGALAREQLDLVVASTARRAVETATPLAALVGRPLATRPALLEYDFGSPSYVAAEDADDPDPVQWETWADWGRPVDEDSPVAAFRTRVSADLAALAADNPGANVAVVCHGGTINAYVGDVLASPVPFVFIPDYVGITRVLVDREGRRTVRSVNETGHVRDLLR